MKRPLSQFHIESKKERWKAGLKPGQGWRLTHKWRTLSFRVWSRFWGNDDIDIQQGAPSREILINSQNNSLV